MPPPQTETADADLSELPVQTQTADDVTWLLKTGDSFYTGAVVPQAADGVEELPPPPAEEYEEIAQSMSAAADDQSMELEVRI